MRHAKPGVLRLYSSPSTERFAAVLFIYAESRSEPSLLHLPPPPLPHWSSPPLPPVHTRAVTHAGGGARQLYPPGCAHALQRRSWRAVASRQWAAPVNCYRNIQAISASASPRVPNITAGEQLGRFLAWNGPKVPLSKLSNVSCLICSSREPLFKYTGAAATMPAEDVYKT